MIRGLALNILALTVLGSVTSRAAELLEVNTSPRAMGMGNAYTSVVSDKDALFYNPARLSKVEGINLTIADPYVGANGQDVYDTYQDLNDSNSTTSAFATQLRRLYGRKIWLGGGGKMAFATPNFAIAGYDAFSGSAYLSNPAFPNLNVSFANDYGVAAGLSFPLGPGLHAGFTGRRITRVGAQFPVGVSTLALLSSNTLQDQLNNRGTGYALDFGSTFQLPSPVTPTLSFVWKNMGWTTFTQDFGARAPPMIQDEMIAGFGLLVDLPGLDIRYATDLKYLNRYREPLGKKLHFGLELEFPFLSLRGGFNQGYYTAGAGVDIGFLRADVATYGVELGVYPGQHEDRRYVAQVTLELGFDPSLSFLKGGGDGSAASRRRLKQRR